MKVDAKTVHEIAALARLKVADERIEPLAKEMQSLLEFMGTISSWEGLPDAERQPAVRRADEPHNEGDTGLASAAAHTDKRSVVVPPIKGAS